MKYAYSVYKPNLRFKKNKKTQQNAIPHIKSIYLAQSYPVTGIFYLEKKIKIEMIKIHYEFLFYITLFEMKFIIFL